MGAEGPAACGVPVSRTNPSKPYGDQEASIMGNVAEVVEQPKDKTIALLTTRCGCERTIEITLPLPRTVTIELEPLAKGAPKEDRVFYLTATGSHPKVKGTIYLYREGPGKEKSMIVIP